MRERLLGIPTFVILTVPLIVTLICLYLETRWLWKERGGAPRSGNRPIHDGRGGPQDGFAYPAEPETE